MADETNDILNEQDDTGLARRVAQLEIERKLMMKLAQAGAADIETAVLVGMSRLGQSEAADIDGVIAAMKRDKAHLFAHPGEMQESPLRTGGARRKGSDCTAVLVRAAKRAAASGSRTDLQEYLRLRRER